MSHSFVSITGASQLAQDLTAVPWTDAKLRRLVSELKRNDREGLAFCFNEFVQACVKAGWKKPLDMFLQRARVNSPHKKAVEATLLKKSIKWKDQNSLPVKAGASSETRIQVTRRTLRT